MREYYHRPYADSLTLRFWLELRATVEAISRCDHVRVIVVGSALEKFWTAGLDSKLPPPTRLTAVTQTALSGNAKPAPKAIDPARAALDWHDHMTVSGLLSYSGFRNSRWSTFHLL